jgi:Ricin-type beta-trefoil lectin domain
MRRYSWVAVAATLVLALAVAAVVTPNANGMTWHGGEAHTLTATHSGKCLDLEYTLWFRGVKIFNTDDGAGVVQSTCASPGSPARICTNPSGCAATNQYWGLLTQINGPSKLQNRLSSKCLDVAGDSTVSGARVVQMPCRDEDKFQLWEVSETATGSKLYRLKNGSSGLCLEVASGSQGDGATVVQGTCSNANNQVWDLYNIPLGFHGI